MRPFDALILDLFGVVIAFDEDLVYRRLAAHCVDPDAAFGAMQGLVSRDDLICGRLRLDELHRELAEAHGLRLTTQEFEAAWLRPYSQPMPGMATLIRQLADRCELVLLSNVDPHYWQALRRRHAELEHFAALLVSCETGAAKPELRAFQGAIDARGVLASRCCFIDDKAENIEAAQRLGLRGHRFVDTETLRATLSRLGAL